MNKETVEKDFLKNYSQENRTKLEEKDRIGQYLVPHLSEMIFDELSENYLKKAGIADILTDVPIPIRKTELNNITTLSMGRNMAFVIGCDPNFEYKDQYIAYIHRVFEKKFALGLIGDGLQGAAKNDYDYACIQFRGAMLVDPDNAEAYYCYGRACKDAYEQASAQMELSQDAEDFVGRFKAESLEAFEIATLKNPAMADAYYFLGYGYINLGLYVKAQLTWQEYMKLTAESQEEGISELREEIAQRLVSLAKPVEIEKGYNLILSGKYEEGIVVLESFKDGEFTQWWPLWYYLGIAYKAVEREDDAIAALRQVLVYAPSNLDAMEELLKLYENKDDLENIKKYQNKIEIVKQNMEMDRQLSKEQSIPMDQQLVIEQQLEGKENKLN